MAAQASSVKQVGKVFNVAIIGATENDLKIFTRIFEITRYRPRIYKMIAVDAYSPAVELEKATAADIHIVNLHNHNAVLCWYRLSATIPKERRKPVLKISKVTPTSDAGSELTIAWPINPAKMLQSLDGFTVRHLSYCPEFEIGSEEETTVDALKSIYSISAANQPNGEVRKENAIRVLVADDSLAVRRQLKIEFDIMDASLNSVADGESAVRAAETEKYDVIFLDVVMPGIDGYTACKCIRKTKLNKNTPVVMLTSRSSSFDKLKGVLAGCDTYLTKPINHNEFTEITQKHLSKNTEKKS